MGTMSARHARQKRYRGDRSAVYGKKPQFCNPLDVLPERGFRGMLGAYRSLMDEFFAARYSIHA